MSKGKLTYKEIHTLDECIQMAEDAVTDAEYRHNKAKAPNMKRKHASGLKVWQSFAHHLKQFQNTIKINKTS